jgi:predicted metallo-beta-lactamase superfamily hydrolase
MPELQVIVVRRYQRGNQNPYIERQNIQRRNEKGKKYKQWLTKHYTQTINDEQQEPHRQGID